MIQPNELRKGSKVSERDNHRIYDVLEIRTNGAVVKYWSCGETKLIAFNELMPVPLTSEVLESVDYLMDSSNARHWLSKPVNGEAIRIVEGGFGYRLAIGSGRFRDIKYLHQLQDIHFVLAGKELSMRLSEKIL